MGQERTYLNATVYVVAIIIILGVCSSCDTRYKSGRNVSSNGLATFRGKIRKDGQPAQNARLYLRRPYPEGVYRPENNKETKADTNGQFVFEEVKSGAYYLSIELPLHGAAPCDAAGFHTAVYAANGFLELSNKPDRSVEGAAPYVLKGGETREVNIDISCPFRAFDQYISQYTALAARQDKVNSRNIQKGRPADAYIAGKVVVINKEGLDKLYFDLPEELRARTPDEVSSVVFVYYHINENSTGYYQNGTPAVEWKCEVTLIDKRKGTVLDKQSFAGSQAPMSVETLNGAAVTPTSGTKPYGEILKYITSLPRR